MTQINLKLFASLRQHLPGEIIKSTVQLECDNDNNINAILKGLNVPLEHCHLVLVNGVFIAPLDRDNKTLVEGDTLAVWPPVAGG